jgi:hypothetical protein
LGGHHLDRSQTDLKSAFFIALCARQRRLIRM